MNETMNEILYPENCDKCPALLAENYGATRRDECRECERRAKYGVYRNTAGEWVLA